MNKSLILIAFSLLCWGWLLNIWMIASGLLLVILFLKFRRVRFQMPLNQYRKWGDVATLLVVFVLVYVYLIEPRDLAVFFLLKCLPIIYAPVLFAQLLSTEQKIPLSTLFYSLRKQSPKNQKFLDFQIPYAALTFLSAGSANVQNPLYFFMAACFCVGLLWSVRPVQSRLWLWLPTIMLAVVLSYYGQLGIRQLSLMIEEKSLQWLSNMHTDPFKTQTTIGDIGELKLSDKIVFRLKADAPMLLQQANYNRFYGQKWFSSNTKLYPVNPASYQNGEPLKQLTIFQNFNKDTVLALPDGTVKINGLKDATLEYSKTGAVIINTPPNNATLTVLYNGRRTDKPDDFDLQIPGQHLDWLNSISKALQLQGQTPDTIAAKLSNYFQQEFRYSLFSGTANDPDQALKDFMLKTRTGHCEYFAVATVLLLRKAKIPARLATGYSVSEYNRQLGLYAVRSRHAHAWAQAWINGNWVAVDSTPMQWSDMEADNASLWQSVTDTWSNAIFYVEQWYQQLSEQQRLQVKLTGSLMLGIYLFLRLILSKDEKAMKITNSSSDEIQPDAQGLDSDFYLIEQLLATTTWGRLPKESMQQWVLRINQPELTALYRLHYQYRFDPNGLNCDQRQLLRFEVAQYLKRLKLAENKQVDKGKIR